jgi:uncharacterized protein
MALMDEARDDRPGAAMDRSVLIDALRATALFGVIVMNMVGMVMLLKAETVLAAASPTDLGIGAGEVVLLMGKARSVFAFLFGLGFGVMMDRLQARGANFTPYYLRRTLILLVIGVLNLAFLFWGDILIVYALLGMVLILFRNMKSPNLLALGLGLIVAPPVVFGLIEAVTGQPLGNLAGAAPEAVQGAYQALTPAYLGSDFGGYVQANFVYYLHHNLFETAYVAVYDIGVLGLFMVGVWAARIGLLTRVEAHRPLLRRIAWVALPLGLALSVLYATRPLGMAPEGAWSGVVTAAYLGLPVLAFGYLAVLALWFSRSGRGLARLLAPMGRMALTGYLASNAIGSFWWYGWGLGRLGDPAALNVVVLSLLPVAVFAGLWIFSGLWLSVCRFGPAEWIWRSLTYGRLQPFLKRPAV